MRYVSVFSGIEAASVAWQPLGWEPVAFSEIEAFPSAVLAARYPRVPNLGDITKIDWSKHDDCRTADVLVGGSPCQSFSIAGARTGLDGASGLMWEYVRAVRELRPRWLVWENVPGALSSSHGEDFACLLRALDGLGYGLAWRVLDAQYFGVAQRRRRVYLVGSLGNTRACDVLFEPDCLRWDHPTGREKRQALAGQAQGGAGGADGGGGCLTPWDTQSRRVYRPDGAWPTLDTRARSGGDGRAVYEISGNAIGRVSRVNGGHHLGVCNPDEDGAYTLTTSDRHAVAIAPVCATDSGANAAIAEDYAPTLTAHEGKSASYVHMPAPLQIRGGKPGGGKGALVQEDMSATLTAAQTQTLFPGDGTVRRLTPTECERLQGFPDGWTDVPYRGKEHAPDSPRYKALGNSMAVPVMAWIGRRILQAEEAVS